MIDPVAFSILGLDVRWYGLFYVFGFLFGYFFVMHYAKEFKLEKKRLEDLYIYTMIISVLGGRVFHIIFYNLDYYVMNPLEILAVWNGGMSIHGGFFFGALSVWYFSRKYKFEFLKVTDLFVIPLALGLAFGRLANFINQEIVGTVTSSSYGVVFPAVDDQNRWPYQIFAGFKNLVTFNILYALYIFKELRTGVLTGLFLILYSFGRIFVDIIREETNVFFFLSMGQTLSLVFGLFGCYLIWKAYQKNPQQSFSSSNRKGKR